MDDILFYCIGSTPALHFACKALLARGLNFCAEPSKSTTHLLLPVPTFDDNGFIHGSNTTLSSVLQSLPENVTILGGNLSSFTPECNTVIDLLQDPIYLAENAAITADCAIRIIVKNLPVILNECRILIIGWGRIGKCLADKLKALGADVTVAARKVTDRATLLSLDYRAKDPTLLFSSIDTYRVIINTVPAPVITDQWANRLSSDTIKIDLASQQGIFCQDVIWARGLPNKHVPESSGQLIARSILRLISGKEFSV